MGTIITAVAVLESPRETEAVATSMPSSRRWGAGPMARIPTVAQVTCASVIRGRFASAGVLE
ncbi:hypothetical protein KYC5002_10010 [Archangium violaceum]|uniref:hypothetical protein n=1 Tax=Archangium violaceum TaxID=83451 RepID=UPI002B2DE024|nr:hypothetical protein KYC5002_10010 [Archangium gephyra]